MMVEWGFGRMDVMDNHYHSTRPPSTRVRVVVDPSLIVPTDQSSIDSSILKGKNLWQNPVVISCPAYLMRKYHRER